MGKDIKQAGPAGLMMGIGLATLLVMAIFTGIALAVTNGMTERPVMFWVFVGFVDGMIGLGGLYGLDFVDRSKGGGMSLPAKMLMGRFILRYAVLGTISIILYWIIRSIFFGSDADAGAPEENGGPGPDTFFGIWMLLLTAGSFFSVLPALAVDRYFQKKDSVIREVRTEHKARSFEIGGVIDDLKAARLEGEQMVRRDKLVTRLNGLSQMLAHSHGGGYGSNEQNKTIKLTDDDARKLESLIDRMSDDADRLASGASEDTEHLLSELDRSASKMDRVLESMSLH